MADATTERPKRLPVRATAAGRPRSYSDATLLAPLAD